MSKETEIVQCPYCDRFDLLSNYDDDKCGKCVTDTHLADIDRLLGELKVFGEGKLTFDEWRKAGKLARQTYTELREKYKEKR